MDQAYRFPINVMGMNLYDVLGVPHNASIAEIRKARNRKALKLHTDKSGTDGTTQKMAHVNLAYDVLTSQEGRSQHDAQIREGSDDTADYSGGVSNNAFVALSQGRRRSEVFAKNLERWRIKGMSERKYKKPAYAPKFIELTAQMKQMPKTPTRKVASKSRPLQTRQKEMHAVIQLLDEFYKSQRPSSPASPEQRIEHSDRRLCVDRHHAILDSIKSDSNKINQLVRCFGGKMTPTFEQLQQLFPDKCVNLSCKMPRFQQSKGEPLGKIIAPFKKPTGLYRHHGISKAKDVVCRTCNKTPGTFTRLFDLNTNDTHTTCQQCAKCFCYDCVKSCSLCDRWHCSASCIKSCSTCKTFVCHVCSTECIYCRKRVCLLKQTCSSTCNRCFRVSCQSCLTSCQICHVKFCNDYISFCEQCRSKVCFGCVVSCIACGTALCCPSNYRIANYSSQRPFCNNCMARLKRDEAELWFELARKTFSSGKMHLAVCQLAIAGYICPQIIDGHCLLKFAESQPSPRLVTNAVMLLFGDFDSATKEANNLLLRSMFATATQSALDSSLADSASNLKVLRQVNLVYKTMLSDSDLVAGDKQLETATRLATDLMEELVQHIKEDTNGFAPILEKIKNACAGGYFGTIAETLQCPSLDDDIYLEIAVNVLEAAGFETSMKPQNLPLFDIMKGTSYLQKAHYKLKKEPYILTALSSFERAYWTGWIKFDTEKLAEIMINSIVHSSLELGVNRLQLLRQLLSDEPSVGNYPFVNIPYENLKPTEPVTSWTYISLPNHDLIPIRKYEYAIRKNIFVRKTWKALDAALAYIDMLDLCQFSVEQIVCFLNAGLWMLQSLEEAVHSNQKEEIFARAKFLSLLTDLAMATAFQTMVIAPIKLYAARLCAVLNKRAGELTGFAKFAKSMQKFLDTALFFAPYCPSLLAPIVPVADACILQIGYIKIYSVYLETLQGLGEAASQLVGDDYKPMLDYLQFEIKFILANRDDEECVMVKRSLAMSSLLLKHDGLSNNHVEHFMTSPLVQRDQQGWFVKSSRLLGPLKSGGFRKINGVAINPDNGSIQLLAEEANGNGFICWEDILTCFSLDISEPHALFFSLEAPNDKMTLHPFQEFKFLPNEIHDSLVLHSMFHTDYLLKQFSTGVEISSCAPFCIRPAREGLLRGLPDIFSSLEHGILRSLRERGGYRQHQLRMWIQADELKYDVQHGENGEVQYVFADDVKMTIRFKPMLQNAEGRLEDIDDENEFTLKPGEDGEDDPLKAVKEFCYDLTKNYSQLGREFPEFHRLKEICKLFTTLRMLHRYSAALQEQARDFKVTPDIMLKIESDYKSEYNRYNAVKQEVRSNMQSILNQVKAQIPYNVHHNSEVIEAVTSSLSQACGINWYDLESLVRSWLCHGNIDLLERLVNDKVPAPSHPSKEEIERQMRAKYATTASNFERSMTTIRDQCRNSRAKGFGQVLVEKPWVPAVCENRPIEGLPGASMVVYGGVLLAPNLRHVDLPTYKDGLVNICVSVLQNRTLCSNKMPSRVSSGGNDNYSQPPGGSDKHSSIHPVQGADSVLEGISTLYRSIQEIGTPWEIPIIFGRKFELFCSQLLSPEFLYLDSRSNNFPAFDYYDPHSEKAVSCKSLQANTDGYQKHPKRIFNQMKIYIDQMTNFQKSGRKGYPLNSEMIKSRDLFLAVPANMSKDAIVELIKVYYYALEKGVVTTVIYIID